MWIEHLGEADLAITILGALVIFGNAELTRYRGEMTWKRSKGVEEEMEAKREARRAERRASKPVPRRNFSTSIVAEDIKSTTYRAARQPSATQTIASDAKKEVSLADKSVRTSIFITWMMKIGSVGFLCVGSTLPSVSLTHPPTLKPGTRALLGDIQRLFLLPEYLLYILRQNASSTGTLGRDQSERA